MGWENVTPSEEVEAAGWIAPRLHAFGLDTGAVIPAGFDAYGRVPERSGLAVTLTRHTSTPDRCWFCLWDGYGVPVAMTVYPPGTGRPRTSRFTVRLPRLRPRRPSRKLVQLPNREYRLFTGPVAKGEGWVHGPNLWWPEDRAWCVASEIDLDYTLVGGTEELIGELMGASRATRVTENDPL